MTNIRNTILIAILLLSSINVSAQMETYGTSGLEMIFSFVNIEIAGEEQPTSMRWSPVINFHFYGHADFSEKVGVFTGLAVRNVGLIFNDQTDNNNLHIYRTYNLGIPFGLKVGNMEKGFFYGGYEIEFPFHYKHKWWQSSDRSGPKTKETYWFSGRTLSPQQAWFVGVQFRTFNLKFKQYFTNFFNQDFTKDGAAPFADYEANIFYISLTARMTRNLKFYYFED